MEIKVIRFAKQFLISILYLLQPEEGIFLRLSSFCLCFTPEIKILLSAASTVTTQCSKNRQANGGWKMTEEHLSRATKV